MCLFYFGNWTVLRTSKAVSELLIAFLKILWTQGIDFCWKIFREPKWFLLILIYFYDLGRLSRFDSFPGGVWAVSGSLETFLRLTLNEFWKGFFRNVLWRNTWRTPSQEDFLECFREDRYLAHSNYTARPWCSYQQESRLPSALVATALRGVLGRDKTNIFIPRYYMSAVCVCAWKSRSCPPGESSRARLVGGGGVGRVYM